MSYRLNISIPDGLHERLQAVKDSVNVSQLCQIAIEQEVKMLEAVKSATSGKEAHIAKLKKQKEESMSIPYNEGKEAVLRDITDWDYSDFENLYDWYEKFQAEKPHLETRLKLHEIESYFRDLGWDAPLEIAEEYKRQSTQLAFYIGYIEGALQYFEEIKSELD